MSHRLSSGPPPETPERKPSQPSDWRLVALITGVVLLLSVLALLSRRLQTPQPTPPSAESEVSVPAVSAPLTPIPTATPAPVSTPTAQPAVTPTPEPTLEPLPTPEPLLPPLSQLDCDWTQPLPASDPADPASWFEDAVFIGDSRVEGLHAFSGIQGGDFLTYTGLTIFQVENDEEVIRVGDQKLPLLDVLALKQYRKVYLSLGVNELGYFNPTGFADACAAVIRRIRACQPGAVIYVQSVLPVNTEKCKERKQPYYITNPGIVNANAALADMAAQEKVFLLSVPDELVDEAGETLAELSSDGVHLQKEGYLIWLSYLLTHTGREALPAEFQS